VKDGQLNGLFRTPGPDFTATPPTWTPTWQSMSVPVTNENGTVVGIQPDKGVSDIPGSQGVIHFSIAADPTNPDLVYVGGDRQPGPGDGFSNFPNSIGATNFTGRLFRGDATQPAATQWTPITNDFTTNNTGPHADSRHMAFDSGGNLVEVDDGGIYRRTSPQTSGGDWFSEIGNLQVTEAHSVAYDSLTGTLIAGDQDTGTPEQTAIGNTVWSEFTQGDGGDVSIDNSLPTQSIRYTSFPSLGGGFPGGLNATTYDSTGTLINQTFPNLFVPGPNKFLGQLDFFPFVTPVVLNAINPTWMVVSGQLAVWESVDGGNNFTQLFGGGTTNSLTGAPMAYGGMLNGAPNPFVLWVGTGAQVLLRTANGGFLNPTSYAGGTVTALTINPNNWQEAIVADSSGQVWLTTNAGTTFSNITGLNALTTNPSSAAFAPSQGAGAGFGGTIFIGTQDGVYDVPISNTGTASSGWQRYAVGMPDVPVFSLEYIPGQQVLVAGTMGRGTFIASAVGDLSVSVSPTGASPLADDAGTVPKELRITRDGPTAGDLTVTLTSSDPTIAIVPATAVIPSGQSFVDVPVTVLDPQLAQGPTTVVFTATGGNLNPISAAIDIVPQVNPPITNTAGVAAPALQPLTASASGGNLATGTYFYEVTALTLTGETTVSNERFVSVTGPLGKVTITWNAVPGATGYNVYRGRAPGAENVLVGTVAGGGTTTFADTGLIRGTPAFEPNSAGDNDTPALTVTIANGTVVTGGTTQDTFTATVSRNTPTTDALTVILVDTDPTAVELNGATGPTTVTIPAGAAFATFTITALDHFIPDINRVVTVTAAADGFASSSGTIGVLGISHVIQYNQPVPAVLGDVTKPRPQGEIVLQDNQISNPSNDGILAEGVPYAANGPTLPFPGGVVNTPVLDSAGEARGVVIANNLIYGVSAGGAGVAFEGIPTVTAPGAVPFGRIVNNTIYGGNIGGAGTGSGTGTGILVANNASPTMLNNVLVNLNTGISVDASSKGLSDPPVIGENLYQNDGTASNDSVGPFAETPTGPASITFRNPSTDPSTANFYLTDTSVAIDSSINSLQDRVSMTSVGGPLGVAPSPIISPIYDLYGQLRVADPKAPKFTGLGNNVFIDRGAVEHAATVGPTANLLAPNPSGSQNLSTTPNQVFLRGQSLSEFTIQLSDGTGPGVYDASVLASSLDVIQDGRLLVPGVDYFFDYDNNNHIIHLVAASGVWLNGHQYDIYLDNGNKFDPYNPSATLVGSPGPGPNITDLANLFLQANETDGFTHFRLLLANTGNTAPVINVPSSASIHAAYQASLSRSSPALPTGSIYEGTSVTFGVAQGDPITVYDVDANGGSETITVTANTGTLSLTNTALIALQTIGIDITKIGNGTGTITLTAPIGDPTTVPPTAGIDSALDGLVYTPDPNFNSQAFGQQAMITVSVNDNGNSPPPALTASTTIGFNVVAVNNAPYVTIVTPSGPETITTRSVPARESDVPPNGQFVFSAANGNQIQVHDPDLENLTLAPGDVNNLSVGVPPALQNPYYADPTKVLEEKITLAPATAGTVTLGSTTGLTTVSGNGTALLDFTGTLSAIDNALAALTFSVKTEFAGTVTFTFVTNDNGNVGLGPAPTYASGLHPLTNTAVINVNVVSDNDAPVLNAPGPLSFPSIHEDAGSGLPGEPAANGSTVQSMLSSQGSGAPAAPPAVNTAGLPAPVQTAPVSATSGGVLSTSAYYYEITATLGGGETTVSNEQGVQVFGPNGEVTLNWNAVAGATGYKIYRGTLPGQENVLVSTVGATTTLVDTGGGAAGTPPATDTATILPPTQPAAPVTSAAGGGLAAGTYYYVVTATTAAGQTTASNEQSITVGGATSDVTVSWSAVAGATGYKIYRGTTAGGENLLVGTASGEVTSLVDYGGAISTTAADASGDGIAIANVVAAGSGVWQYSLNGGTTWTPFPTGLSTTRALLLSSSDLVRYVPQPETSGNVSLTFYAWDGSFDFGTQADDQAGNVVNLTAAGFGVTSPFSLASATATLSVQADLDAPSLTAPAVSLGSIKEDAGQPEELPGNPNNGFLISSSAIGTDVNLHAEGAQLGVAVTGVTGNGQWQVSFDGGSTWPVTINPATGVSSALLLDGSDRVRFLPNEEAFGLATIAFAGWDETFDAITGATDLPSTASTPTIVDLTQATSDPSGSLPFSESSAGKLPVQTAIATLTVNPGNDAPSLTSNSVSLAAISEDLGQAGEPANNGFQISTSVIGSDVKINASAGGGKLGIAVTGISSGSAKGQWQWSVDDKNWTTIISASPSSALLLDGSDWLRFLPAEETFGTGVNSPTISFAAWDETYDALTGTVDAPSAPGSPTIVDLTKAVAGSDPGGSLPFSESSPGSLPVKIATASLPVNPGLDAPTLTKQAITLTSIGEDAGQPNEAADPGFQISDPINGLAKYVTINTLSEGGKLGIAVTGVTGGGQWQWSADGTSWNAISATTSLSNAMLLDGSDFLRFLPSEEFFGTGSNSPTISLAGWDETYDALTGRIDLASTPATPTIVSLASAGSDAGGSLPFSESTPGTLPVQVATAALPVKPGLDAPTLTQPSMTLASIGEDVGQANEAADAGFQISDPLNGLAKVVTINTLGEGGKLGIAVTGVTGGGQWQWSTDDKSWNAIPATITTSTALLLDGSDYLRFLPNEEFFGTASNSPTISFAAWDETYDALTGNIDVASTPTSPTTVNLASAVAGGDAGGSLPFSESTPGTLPVQIATASLPVNPGLDAPTFTQTSIGLPAIKEDQGQPSQPVNNGFQISGSPIAADITINTPNEGGRLGIAVTGMTGGGQWQWSTDGKSWNAIPATTTISTALLLDGSDYLRFLPNEEFVGTGSNSPTISFAAWDETYDALTGKFDGPSTPGNLTIVNLASAVAGSDAGGSLPFSESTPGTLPVQIATGSLPVNPGLDAPTLNVTNVTLPATQEDSGPSGNKPAVGFKISSSPIAGAITINTLSAGGRLGIAVTGADDSNGQWQWSVNGTTWVALSTSATSVVTPTLSSALLLDGSDWLRFVPNPEFYTSGQYAGPAPTITFAAWDQTDDLLTLVKGQPSIDPVSTAAQPSTIDLTKATSDPGGSLPFSESSPGVLPIQLATGTIAVTPDNDAPQLDTTDAIQFNSV
ncbi:MAG TPA: hypothetical protein VG125_03470, partial [Pirellulales bacterium]|nr:hypothetical protein [Pirellulales bacterium]